MTRRGQFTVDASSIQGNDGATITFRALKVREVREYRETAMTDTDLLQSHVVAWSGILDDDGHELPSPADDPEVVGELYVHEQTAIARLLFLGPLGDSVKN